MLWDGFLYDVFISYAAEDRAWVEGFLLDALKAAGVVAHTEAAFVLGVPRLEAFEHAVQHSRHTLLVLSPAYLADDVARFVNVLAQHFGLESGTWPVIPLMLKSVRLPPRLSMLTTLDASDPDIRDGVVARLCEKLQKPLPLEPEPPPCPYPGMRPFTTEQEEFFFGREVETEEAVGRLALHPFLTVIGPSGSGKSSLVFAGIIPTLRRSPLFGVGQWQVHLMQPGETPLTRLNEILAQIDYSVPSKPLLVVDQFEETFTLAHEEAEPFQEVLANLVAREALYLLLTVRADFYPDLMNSPMWEKMKIREHRLDVTPLSEDGLRKAIEQPAAQVGVHVEATLVERMVADAAGEPGVLPMVQETLVLLWKKMERRFLPLRAYEQLVLAYKSNRGEVRTGIHVALVLHANKALRTVPNADMARRIILRLIHFGEGRPDTRRQQSYEALQASGDDPVLLAQTLNILTDHRLLTASGKEGDAQRLYEFSHESLIESWPRLQEWLAERRESEQTRRHLEAKAEEWNRIRKHGNGEGGLLDEYELKEAESWLDSAASTKLGVSDALQALVERSRKAEEARKTAEELAQRERERLAHERAVQQGRARLFLRYAVVVTIVVLVTAAFALELYDQMNRAQASEEREAMARSTAEAAGEEALVEAAAADEARATAEAAQQVADSLATAGEALFELSKTDQDRAPLLALASAYSNTWDVSRTDTNYAPLIIQALNDTVNQLRVRQVYKLSTSSYLTPVAWSPDGKWFAMRVEENLVELVNIRAKVRQQIRTAASVSALEWSSSGDYLAIGTFDGSVTLWNLFSEVGTTLEDENNGRIELLSWSLAGDQLLVLRSPGSASVWNVEARILVAHLDISDLEITDGHWMGETPIAVVVGEATVVALWDIRNKVEIDKFTVNGSWNLSPSATLSPDGEKMVVYHSVGMIWSVERNELIAAFNGPITPPTVSPLISALDWSPESDRVAIGGADGIVRVIDANTGETNLILEGHDADITNIRWAPTGDFVLSTSADGTQRLWEVRPKRPTAIVDNFGSSIRTALWSPDATLFVTGDTEGAVRIRERVGTIKQEFDTGEAPLWSLAWSPDGQRVVGGTAIGEVYIWDLVTDRPVQKLEGHTDWVRSVAWSPDGQHVVSGGDDGTARIWNASTGALVRVLEADMGWVWFVRWSPDGQFILTCSEDGLVRMWNVSQAVVVQRFIGYKGYELPCSWSPDGNHVATATTSGDISIWEVEASTVEQTLIGPGPTIRDSERIYSVGWSPDGRQLAAGYFDGSFAIWDVESGEMLQLLKEHSETITSVDWSSDGTRLLVSSEDGTASIWIVDPHLLRARLTEMVCAIYGSETSDETLEEMVKAEIPTWRGCNVELMIVEEALARYYELGGN